MSAQRHEIEAWVNPAAWEDEAEAGRVIDAIVASGSDSEADWVRLSGSVGSAVLDAAARDYDRAGQVLEQARNALRDEVVAAAAAGMSEAEAARRAGVTRMTIRKWVGK